jgi:hypothetical protein
MKSCVTFFPMDENSYLMSCLDYACIGKEGRKEGRARRHAW